LNFKKSILLFLILFSGFVLSSEISDSSNGLVALWHFNGTLTDSSENSNNGICTNCPVLATGKYGQAYDFDGETQYITIPYSSEFDSQDFSITTWFKTRDTNKKNTIISFSEQGLSNMKYRIHVLEGGGLSILYRCNGGWQHASNRNEIVQENVWHHATATFKIVSGTNTLKLYLDGQEVASTETSCAPESPNSNDLRIGHNILYGEYFNGAIDELAIWNKELTPLEISEIADAEAPPVTACGDGTCDAEENCSSCSEDCGNCESSGCPDYTGNNIVNIFDLIYIGSRIPAGEYNLSDLINVAANFGNCQAATNPICGNGVCETGETTENCSSDCAQQTSNCTLGEAITSECDCYSELVTSGYCCETGWQETSCEQIPNCSVGQSITSNCICEGIIYSQGNCCIYGYSDGACSTASPQAKITVSEGNDWHIENKEEYWPWFSTTRGYAPFPVFFEGWESTPREAIVEYTWNFNDPTAYSENPNTLKGFNSAHVFEEPGTYTVNLTIKNAQGQTSTTTKTIEVFERDGTTYYLDSENGADSYSGECTWEERDLENNCGPWQNFTKIWDEWETNELQPGDAIRFKRGQIFERGDSRALNSWRPGGILFSDYGSGAKPVLQTTPGSGLINFQGHGHIAMTFENIEFRGETADERGVVFYDDGGLQNILFLRVDLKNFAQGLLVGSGQQFNSGFFVFDSTIYRSEITHLFYNGSRLALIGNNFDLAGNHIAYLTYVDKGVVVNNSFTRPAFGRAALRIDDATEGSGYQNWDLPSNNVYLANNHFGGWIDECSCVGDSCTSPPDYEGYCIPGGAGGGAHNGEGRKYNIMLTGIVTNNHWVSPGQSFEDITFENNLFTNAGTLMAVVQSENTIIRNNVFISNSNYADYSISLGEINEYGLGKPNKNLKFIGNTIITNITQERAVIYINDFTFFDPDFEYPFDYDEQQNIQIKNNIIYRKTYNWPLIKIAPDAELFEEVHLANNIYFVADDATENLPYFNYGDAKYTLYNWKALKPSNDLGSIFGNPQFTSFSFDETNDHQLILNDNVTPGSSAIDAGANIFSHLFKDYDGTQRPRGSGFDIGAYEVR